MTNADYIIKPEQIIKVPPEDEYMNYTMDDLISTVEEMLRFKVEGPNNAVSMVMELNLRGRLEAILAVLRAAKILYEQIDDPLLYDKIFKAYKS